MIRIANCLFSIPVFSTGFLSFYLLLTFFSSLPFCISACPYNVQKESHNCFEGYNTQLTALQTSHTDTLFSGVNIEVLRSFCSAYINAMKCIQQLKKDCPRQIETIDQAFTNLEGAQEELSELCMDDKIYEVYAMYLTCFYNEGAYSERCFRTHMNTSKNLLSRLDDQPLEILCRNLRNTLDCIQSNIEMKCGKKAGDLVPKLVKPMVRRSTHCTQYSVITTTQKPSATRRPQQGANTNNRINSANIGYLNYTLILLVLLISMHSTKIS